MNSTPFCSSSLSNSSISSSIIMSRGDKRITLHCHSVSLFWNNYQNVHNPVILIKNIHYFYFMKVMPMGQCNDPHQNYLMKSSCVHAKSLSHVWLFMASWTVARQPPLSMGFSRQESWSGLPCPPPGDLPDPGIETISLTSPALAGGFFTNSATWNYSYIPPNCSFPLLDVFSLTFTHS